jgi:hypothetical protein
MYRGTYTQLPTIFKLSVPKLSDNFSNILLLDILYLDILLFDILSLDI